MTRTYDSIIGSLIINLSDLRQFVEEHESSKVAEVREIQERLEHLDYYMAYGVESYMAYGGDLVSTGSDKDL